MCPPDWYRHPTTPTFWSVKLETHNVCGEGVPPVEQRAVEVEIVPKNFSVIRKSWAVVHDDA